MLSVIALDTIHPLQYIYPGTTILGAEVYLARDLLVGSKSGTKPSRLPRVLPFLAMDKESEYNEQIGDTLLDIGQIVHRRHQ